MPSHISDLVIWRAGLMTGGALDVSTYGEARLFSLMPRQWKRMYSDDTVTNWLQQSTDFFMANANIKDFTPAKTYFDPSLYLKTIA